ncbi:hypothetical protein ACFQX6_67400 [Streptosporangium lutulentum]
MQAWANAVHLGRTGRSLCEVVTPLAQAWDNNPRRETRTKIRMHVTRCPTCSKAFNLRVSAEELLSHLPIPMLSALQQEHLIHPTLPPFPLELHWGPDGFPLQSDLTADHTEVEEAPVFSAGLRAANNRGFWDGDPDAEDARWWRDDPSPEDSPATGQAPSPPRLIDVTLAEGLQRLRRSLPAPSLGGAGRAAHAGPHRRLPADRDPALRQPLRSAHPHAQQQHHHRRRRHRPRGAERTGRTAAPALPATATHRRPPRTHPDSDANPHRALTARPPRPHRLPPRDPDPRTPTQKAAKAAHRTPAGPDPRGPRPAAPSANPTPPPSLPPPSANPTLPLPAPAAAPAAAQFTGALTRPSITTALLGPCPCT